MCGFWLVTQQVSWPVPGLKLAHAARGSIAVGSRRFCKIRCSTLTGASANALAASPPATFQVNATLPGTSACSCGAPSCEARSGFTTASSGS